MNLYFISHILHCTLVCMSALHVNTVALSLLNLMVFNVLHLYFNLNLLSHLHYAII